ncbi:MAG: glycosyltransferase family 4 protein [Pseudomonadota bacterium]
MADRNSHIVFGSPIDIAKTRAEAAARARPRHFMLALADRLGARIWSPENGATPSRRTLGDRIARIGNACAAQAEAIVDAASDDDVIICNTEGASLPIADRLAAAGKKTRLATFAHNLVRPRMRALMTVTGVLKRHDAIYVVAPMLAQALKARLGADVQVKFVREQTDDAFFSPGPAKREGEQALIVSMGMEQRDYRTLAAAAGDLDVDIRISGFSSDARITARAMPDIMPANMQQRFYEWTELSQLYRDADIVIAPVFENNYAAGINTILEGMATGRPVIASRSVGLAGLFEDESGIAWVAPGDAPQLRETIQSLLADPDARRQLAEKGRAVFSAGHRFDDQVEAIAKRLAAL